MAVLALMSVYALCQPSQWANMSYWSHVYEIYYYIKQIVVHRIFPYFHHTHIALEFACTFARPEIVCRFCVQFFISTWNGHAVRCDKWDRMKQSSIAQYIWQMQYFEIVGRGTQYSPQLTTEQWKHIPCDACYFLSRAIRWAKILQLNSIQHSFFVRWMIVKLLIGILKSWTT